MNCTSGPFSILRMNCVEIMTPKVVDHFGVKNALYTPCTCFSLAFALR